MPDIRETIPITRPAPCNVRIQVRENDADETIIHDKTGNHSERHFREWITKTTYWAMRNDKTVVMYPVEAL